MVRVRSSGLSVLRANCSRRVHPAIADDTTAAALVRQSYSSPLGKEQENAVRCCGQLRTATAAGSVQMTFKVGQISLP